MILQKQTITNLNIMNYTNTLNRVAILTFSILLVLTSYVSNGQIPENLKGILSESLDQLQERYDFRGISVAVSYPRQGTWTSARGVSAPGSDLQTNELIGIGSSTKTFVSTTVLLLEEDGLLSLEDTIGTWIQGYDHISGDITIEQLLNHTSGLFSYTDHENFWVEMSKDFNKMWTDEELLRTLMKPRRFAPGLDFEYSNTGYILAGMIIKEVTGKPWYEVVRERIIDPIKLENTFIPPYEEVDKEIADFWTFVSGSNSLSSIGDYGSDDLIPSSVNTMASAAGAILSTPADNALFYKYLLSGKIIKRSTLRNKMMDFIPVGRTNYGLGMFKDRSPAGDDLFSHGGTWIGQVCSNYSDTTHGISVSVLSNQDSLQNSATEMVAITLYMKTLQYYKQHANVVEAPQPERNHKLYPNPIREQYVNIELSNNHNLEVIDIVNTKGQIVESIKGQELYSNKIRLNTMNWSPDLYIVRYTANSGLITYSKIIKQ